MKTPQPRTGEVCLHLVMVDREMTTFSMATMFEAAYADYALATAHVEKLETEGQFAIVRTIWFPATVVHQALHNAASNQAK